MCQGVLALGSEGSGNSLKDGPSKNNIQTSIYSKGCVLAPDCRPLLSLFC